MKKAENQQGVWSSREEDIRRFVGIHLHGYSTLTAKLMSAVVINDWLTYTLLSDQQKGSDGD